MRWKGSRPEIARLHVNRQLLLHLPRRRPCNRTTAGPHHDDVIKASSEAGAGAAPGMVREEQPTGGCREIAGNGRGSTRREASTSRAAEGTRCTAHGGFVRRGFQGFFASCGGFPGGSTQRGNDQPRRHRPATHSPTNCWFSRRACTTCASLPSPPPPPRPPPPTNIFSLSAPPPANPLRAVGAHLRLSTTETDRRPCSQSGWPSGGQPTRPQPPCLRPNDGCLHVSRGNRVQALGTGGSGKAGSS